MESVNYVATNKSAALEGEQTARAVSLRRRVYDRGMRGLLWLSAGITCALLLCAFTTPRGNLFSCEGCLNYIAGHTLGKAPMNLFRVVACLVVFMGAQMKFGLVWDLADVLMGVMALINLPVILILGGTAMRALNDYLAQKKAGKDPAFKAASIGLKEKTDFWN